MSDLNTHIAAAKAALGQRKLNHALEAVVAALEVVADTVGGTAAVSSKTGKTILMEDSTPPAPVTPADPTPATEPTEATADVKETDEAAPKKRKAPAGTRSGDIDGSANGVIITN